MGAAKALRLKLVDDCCREDPQQADDVLARRGATPGFVATDFARRLETQERGAKTRRSGQASEPPIAPRSWRECGAISAGFDPSYHVARHNFIRKIAKSRTPLHLAMHRVAEQRRKGEVEP